jgi:AraC family transcriptional regulator
MTDKKTAVTVGTPRILRRDALLIFGLGQRYAHTNVGMPAQWSHFIPVIGSIKERVDDTTYGVIRQTSEAGAIDYITGVEVRAFPKEPAEFERLQIPAQTYAVFEHHDHVSAVQSTWQSIWGHALSDAKLEATGGPAFERYGKSFDPRTGLGGFELWVPVKA